MLINRVGARCANFLTPHKFYRKALWFDQVSVKKDILTFNWHEPYLSTLASTGHNFTVAEPNMGRQGILKWRETRRPIPKNVRAISEEEAFESLFEGEFDLVICHNFRDVALTKDIAIRKILIFHNSLSCDLAMGGNTVLRERYLNNVAPLVEKVTEFVFVSSMKKDDWNFQVSSQVIPPGIDTTIFRSRNLDRTNRILSVGDRMKDRDLMLGWSLSRKTLDGLENTVIGDGHEKFEYKELLNAYNKHGIYLNTTMEPYEDGYNLALLEAMACGMAVVTISNRTSPIIDGVNGLVGKDSKELRYCVKRLRNDRALANKLGAAAALTVKRDFSLSLFSDRWNKVIANACGDTHLAGSVS